MKTTAFLVIFVLFSRFSLYGQVDIQKQKFDFKLDKPSSQFEYRLEQPSIKINPLPYFRYDDIKPGNINIQKSIDKRDLVFPGASKFYAIASIQDYYHDKPFIVKPDTTNKYYLIIRDPFNPFVIK